MYYICQRIAIGNEAHKTRVSSGGAAVLVRVQPLAPHVPLAQLVEQLAHNRPVPGSNPRRDTSCRVAPG